MARFLAVLLVLAIGFLAVPERGAFAAPSSEKALSSLEKDWMGRFGRRDESLRRLIGSGEGWPMFRDMDLFEAVRFFTMATDPASRMGAARSYIELAQTFEALDGFFLDVETQYLDDIGTGASPAQKARLGFCYLRRGKIANAKEIFSAAPPKDAKFAWSVGRLALKVAAREKGDHKEELKKLAESATKEGKAFIRVAAFMWGFEIPLKDTGYYGQSLTALSSGDLFGSMVALQLIENPGMTGPGPDLYLYALLKQVFGKMAVEALKGVDGSEAALLTGRAKLLLGDWDGAAVEFASARTEKSNPALADSARLFGAELDLAEAQEVAAVYEGVAKHRANKPEEALKLWQGALKAGIGPYAISRLAAEQASAGMTAPLQDTYKASLEALAQLKELNAKGAKMEGAETLSRLLDARGARLSRDSAIAARSQGRMKEALDLLDQAHVKRQGNRPSFVNPPSFLVDLSRAYAESGEFAPAVEILFQLSNQYSSTRMAYESLKRLYASTTGGEAPPR